MSWRLLTLLSVTWCACGDRTVVLLASGQDLDEGTALDKSQLIEVKVSRVLATTNAVPPEALAPLLGKRLRIPLRKGDLLLASYFETNPIIADRVARKARAVTLSVSGAENVHLGDHVDLLAVVLDPPTNEWITTTETQNVIVLSPGTLEPVTGDAAFPLRRVTFLLLPEEAETALLTVRTGGLHVSLRNAEDIDVLEERGRATSHTILSGERSRILQAKRLQLLERPSLPQPHPSAAPLPKDTAPVPVMPDRQE